MTELRSFLAQDDDFDVLSEEECESLLATRTFGRVGVTSGGLPVILPVRYHFTAGVITFRTGSGTKLRAAQSGDVLAFQVDAYDPDRGFGWSVLALGRATVLTTEHEHDGLPTFDPPNPDDRRSHYVSLHCELLTGRRLVPQIPGPGDSHTDQGVTTC